VSVYEINDDGVKTDKLIALRLSNVLVTQPLGMPDLSTLRSVDLPFHGNIQASADDVTIMPYVGLVDLVGGLDTNNVNIQPWTSKGSSRGFIVRGAVSTRLDILLAAASFADDDARSYHRRCWQVLRSFLVFATLPVIIYVAACVAALDA
jgi:hypothetical protein